MKRSIFYAICIGFLICVEVVFASYNVIDKKSVNTATIGGNQVLWNISARWRPNITDIPSMVFWLRPDELVTAGTLASWVDKSGQGNSAVQAIEANKPTVVLNHLNGYAGVQFVDTSDILITSNTIVGEPVTIFIVMKYGTNVTYPNLYAGTDTNGISISIDASTGNYNLGQRGIANFAAATNPLVVGNTYILSTTYGSDNAFTYYKDGSANGTGSQAAAMATQTVQLSTGCVGYFYEVIVCNTVLSDTDRQRIEGYLAAKYGLQSNLPSAHTYKIMIP